MPESIRFGSVLSQALISVPSMNAGKIAQNEAYMYIGQVPKQ